MSSFKRRATEKQTQSLLPGTRISPASSVGLITSTGISSLDDLLGGGVPLSCSVLYAAPDIHSSYGELVQKYFLAEGLVNKHRICLIGEDGEQLLREVMWVPPGEGQAKASRAGQESGDENGDLEPGKVKIAWRYEKMKRFQTTVGSSEEDVEAFCHTYELSRRVPKEVVDEGIEKGDVCVIDPGAMEAEEILKKMGEFLSNDSKRATRVCIPALGTPGWDLSAERILRFLHLLRWELRRHSHGCASIGVARQICAEGWGGPGWNDKMGWTTDGVLGAANPALSTAFPSHHGLVQIVRLPSPHTLSPPSDRFSTLRGLGSSRGGENNLAFKCTRKRLVFETLHLDIEGGTNERRTEGGGVGNEDIEERGPVARKGRRVQFE